MPDDSPSQHAKIPAWPSDGTTCSVGCTVGRQALEKPALLLVAIVCVLVSPALVSGVGGSTLRDDCQLMLIKFPLPITHLSCTKHFINPPDLKKKVIGCSRHQSLLIGVQPA